MIKLANTLVIGLIASSLLVGCGGGSDSEANEGAENEGTEQVETNQPVEGNDGTGGGTTVTPPATSTTSTFGANVMPVLVAKCQACHGSNGNFTITDASMTYSNIMSLPGGAQYMLNKGSGTIGHGGGAVIATSSTEYATIKSWIDAGAANN